MIQQQEMTIVSNRLIAKDTFEMVLEGNLVQLINQPGQFIHIRIGEKLTHLLRRPFSIADYSQDLNQLMIIYKIIGDGSKWLSQQQKTQKINVLGPLGNGFNIKNIKNQKLLIVGGGVGVPPLYNLAKQLSRHNEVTAILGYQTNDAVFYESQFKHFADVQITTDDGTYGEKGFVTNVLSKMNDQFDLYFACGPVGMLRAIQNQLNDLNGYLSVEERMGCGVGACLACVCEANNHKGYVKICQDGPVFYSNEVTL